MSSHKRLLLWKQKFKIDLMSEDLPEDVRSIMSKFIHEVTKEKFTSKTGLSNLSKYLEELNEKNQKYFIQFPSNTKNTATILKSLDCKENWCIACFASAPPRSPLIAFCETGCHVTYSGCGWFWQEPCNRLCRIEFIFGGGGDGLIPTGD